MNRFKVFDATGIAPGGRLYAGDLNTFQDVVAALSDFLQTLDVNVLRVGDASLQLLKYGSGEFRMSGALRTDGIMRALGGFYAGAFTTTARDAIPSGYRPYGLVILNTTTNRLEINMGTDPSPNWLPVGVDPAGTLTFAGQPANNYILTTARSGDTGNRLKIREDGQIEWGSGTGATDTTLARTSAGVLAINGKPISVPNTTSIAALNALYGGSPPDGARAVLRLGTTPYDFVRLAYDSTYGKWVSQPRDGVLVMGGSQNNSMLNFVVNTTYKPIFDSGGQSTQVAFAQLLPWRTFDSAGLLPQFRLVGRLGGDATGTTAFVQIAYLAGDAGQQLGAGVVITGSEKSITIGTSNALYNVDSGWVQIPAGYTVKDYIHADIQIKLSNSTNQLKIGSTGVSIRWVG